MKNKFFSVVLLLSFIFLIQLVSADIIVSPKEPIINGNNWVFVTYNDSALADTSVIINITNPNSELKSECEITLNEYGFGRCKYNFTTSDISGTWGYAINTSVEGTFEVGKVNMFLDERYDLSSIRYGRKTTIGVNFSYEEFLPKDVVRTGLSRDLGTHGDYNYYTDADGDGDEDVVVVDYAGRIYIWDSIDRVLNGVQLITGTDFRSADHGAYYYGNKASFGDFDGDGVNTMIFAESSGFVRAWANLDLTSGIDVSSTYVTTGDVGNYRGSAQICDTNGDGLYDQVAAPAYEGEIRIYAYNDSTGFGSAIYTSDNWGSNQEDSQMLCGNVDSDPYNEWIIYEYVTGARYLEPDHTDPTAPLTLGDQAPDRSNTYISGIITDFDSDGINEVIMVSTTGRLQILEFNQSGTNELEEDITWSTDTDIGSFGYHSSQIQIDDLNNNGRPDFIIAGGVNQPPVYFYEYNPVGDTWTQILVLIM